MGSDVVSRKRLAREKSLPEIPRSLGEEVISSLGAMREQVERLSGKAGDASDRAVRLFEVEMGLLSAFVPTPADVSRDAVPGGGGLRILRAPRDLRYEHQVFGIKVAWVNVEEKYSAVEIWVAEDSLLLSDARRVGLATKPMAEWTMHGISMRASYTFWVRAVDWSGGVSPWCPPQGQGGLIVPAEIETTIGEVLELLTGQVTESHLYQSLSSRIDLIDGPATMEGSVAALLEAEGLARVQGLADEAAARAADIAAEAQARSSALLEEAAARQAAISSESTVRQAADDSLAQQITTLSAALDDEESARIAAVSSEAVARVDGDAAEANARNSLAVQLRGSYTGSDVGQVTSGLIHSERSARVTADEALSNRIDLIVAAGGGDFQDLFAAISAEETARVNADGAIASDVAAVTARLDNVRDKSGNLTNKSVEATLVDNKQAQVDGDSALSSSVSALSSTVTNNFNTLNAAIASEASTRASGDTAEANSRNTLATQLRGSYTGSDINALTSGLIFSERQARATADASEVSSREALATQLRGSYAGTDVSLVTSGLIHSERVARVTADDALTQQVQELRAVFSTAKSVFSDFFEDANSAARWALVYGTGEVSAVSVGDALTGGKVLRVGNNSGDDRAYIVHKGLIPFDPNVLYRITVKLRRVVGSGNVYIGWCGVASNGVTLVGASGGTSYASVHHWHAGANVNPGSGWKTYVGYTKGFGASAGTAVLGSVASPGTVHPSVRYLRPYVVCNNDALAGTVEIDSFVVDDITDEQANAAAITTEQTARASADSAMAANITTLQTTVGGHTAAIQEQAQVIDGLEAQWFVKLDVNGRVTGIGLHGTGATSKFVVLADKFMVVTPGQTPKVPFVVGAIGESGQSGVGIDGGLLVNGSIRARHLDAGSVTADKIGANQISGQHIAVTSDIILNEGGTLTVGQNNIVLDSANDRIVVARDNGTVVGTPNYTGVDYAELRDGNVNFMYWNPDVAQHKLYNSLKRVEVGTDVANNVRITIPGIWKQQPKIIVSPASIMTYSKDYVANQTLECRADNITKNGLTYSFTPKAYLRLTNGVVGIPISMPATASGGTRNTWYYANSSARNTPNFTTSLTVSGQVAGGCWESRTMNQDGNISVSTQGLRFYVRVWIYVDGSPTYLGEWTADQVGGAAWNFSASVSGLASGVHSYYFRVGFMYSESIAYAHNIVNSYGGVSPAYEKTNQSEFTSLANGTLNYMAIGE